MMVSPFEDLRSPQRQLIEWQIEHADLDALIDQTSLSVSTTLDELSLRRMKKRRLALRDQIARLQRMLDPKEPA
ncbi:MAG: YdcH family protein [Limnohabitans sp.]